MQPSRTTRFGRWIFGCGDQRRYGAVPPGRPRPSGQWPVDFVVACAGVTRCQRCALSASPVVLSKPAPPGTRCRITALGATAKAEGVVGSVDGSRTSVGTDRHRATAGRARGAAATHPVDAFSRTVQRICRAQPMMTLSVIIEALPGGDTGGNHNPILFGVVLVAVVITGVLLVLRRRKK